MQPAKLLLAQRSQRIRLAMLTILFALGMGQPASQLRLGLVRLMSPTRLLLAMAYMMRIDACKTTAPFAFGTTTLDFADHAAPLRHRPDKTLTPALPLQPEQFVLAY